MGGHAEMASFEVSGQPEKADLELCSLKGKCRESTHNDQHFVARSLCRVEVECQWIRCHCTR